MQPDSREPPLLTREDGLKVMSKQVARLERELSVAQAHFFFNPNVNYLERKKELQELREKLAKAKEVWAEYQKSIVSP